MRDVSIVIVAGRAQQKSLFYTKGARGIFGACDERRQGDEG
jgi:hypothetical protein